MSKRPNRQQPTFKFWFPFWTNRPTPSPPRLPAPTPRRTSSRVPTQPKELPQSSPSPQPTAAARRSQPLASPSSSESPSPSPSKKSPSRLNPAEVRGKQPPSPSRPTIKPPSPSRAAPTQPSQQGSTAQPATSSTPQGAPDLQPSTALSSSSLLETTIEPHPLESQTQEQKKPERIPIKPVPAPAEVETQLKHKFATESTSIDSTQKEYPAESEPEREKTQFQPPIPGSQSEEIEKSEPELEASKHKKLNEKTEYIPKEEQKQPHLKPKQDVGSSKQQKPNENAKSILEDKTKPDFGQKQNTLTSQVSKRTENFEGIPNEKVAQQPISASKQDKEISENQILDDNTRSIDEDGTKADLEPELNIETSQVLKIGEKHREITKENKHKPEKMRLPETLKSHRMHEEFNNEKPQTRREIHKKLRPGVGEALDEQLDRELTIMGFDAEPSQPHPSIGDLMSDTRGSEHEKLTEQQKLNGKEINKHESIGKVSKVSISAGPWTASCDRERANFQKEINEGLSKLGQKLGIGYSGRAGGDQSVSIITLAGKNKGATMFIGNEGSTKQGLKGQEKGKNETTSDEKRYGDTLYGDMPFAAKVNSNVQSINNSILDESKCEEKNPGVHLVVSTKPTETMSLKGKMEALKTQKAAASISTPQKITCEPNIRRRCLRGLFMEPSEDDPEDPQKPRRHGCRFSCDDKKKEKENNNEGTSKPNRNGKSST